MNFGNNSQRIGTQPSLVVMPQLPMASPFDRISAIATLAQQMGHSIPSQGNSQVPDFDKLMQLFSGDTSHLAPLREAAQKVLEFEKRLYKGNDDNGTYFKDFFLHPDWVDTGYMQTINNARQIAALYGIDTSKFDHLSRSGGFGQALLARVAFQERRTKLDALKAYRQLAQDAARNTATVFGTLKGHRSIVAKPLTSRHDERMSSAKRHTGKPKSVNSERLRLAAIFLHKRVGPWQRVFSAPGEHLRIAIHKAVESKQLGVERVKAVVKTIKEIKMRNPNAKVGPFIGAANRIAAERGARAALEYLERELRPTRTIEIKVPKGHRQPQVARVHDKYAEFLRLLVHKPKPSTAVSSPFRKGSMATRLRIRQGY